MDNYYLKSLEIRKFRNLTLKSPLNFARRINVISGQNGVGKSTILALICASTGNDSFHNPKNKNYKPEYRKFFKVYPEEAVSNDDKENADKRYYVYSNYINEKTGQRIQKRIRLKNNKESDKRVQLIPELTISENSFKSSKTKLKKADYIKKFAKEHNISVAGRLHIPTLYCSISRVYPLEEIDSIKKPTNETLISKVSESNQLYINKLNDFYRDAYNFVLPDSISKDAKLYYYSKKNIVDDELSMEIRQTRPLSRSVGQDSLGRIISCLTDFKYLQILEKEYVGGILCIDEADVALHPAAQKKLLALLYDMAVELNLQIFLTTHSMTMIEDICKRANRHPDEFSINYLKDRYHPRLLKTNSFSHIKADLQLTGRITRPTIQIYFEDEISLKVHKMLLNAAYKLNIPTKIDQYSINTIALKGGKDFLRTVQQKDPYFNTVIVILDADSRFGSSENKLYISDYIFKNFDDPNHNDVKDPRNFLRLPGYFAPESYLYRIYQRYCQLSPNKNLRNEMDAFWEHVDETTGYEAITSQYIRQNWTITSKSKFDNSDLKNEINWTEVISFLNNTNTLAFYYSYDKQRQSELRAYINNLNRLLEHQEKILAASRF